MDFEIKNNSFIATITWHRIIRPEGAFVREEGCGNPVEYGPMPETMLKPFIAEREAFFKSVYEKQTERLRASIAPQDAGEVLK